MTPSARDDGAVDTYVKNTIPPASKPTRRHCIAAAGAGRDNRYQPRETKAVKCATSPASVIVAFPADFHRKGMDTPIVCS